MVDAVKFYNLTEALATEKINLLTDTFKIILSASAPSASSDTQRTDITEISGGGYAPYTVSFSGRSQSGGVTTLTIDADIEIEATGSAMGTFRYASMFCEEAPNDELIAYWDLGENITLSVGSKHYLRLSGYTITLT